MKILRLVLGLALSFSAAADVPNVVLIYADDLGWGDLSCYGTERHETPHLDRMAEEGTKLERFYVSTPSCGPSRVALLTGRYPYRTGVPSNPAPDAGRDHGIRESETLLSEMMKGKGYATKIIGKWHLGHLPEFYPTRHGFDSYFGILYSNDMRPVMLCRDEMAVEYPVVQNYLTKRYTEEAVKFIEEKKDEPFFLYFPHAMPHKPLAASEKFYTPETREDLYSDVIRELDASVGEILAAVKEHGLDEKTIVIFSSDNGPTYGGESGGLRGMKGSSWEGGIRVPGIIRWPGRIPAGQVIKEPCATIDMVPTVCGLFGADTANLNLDGHDIWPLLSGEGAGPKRAIYSWNGTRLLSVSEGKWKYHVVKASARPRGVKGEEWIDPRGPDGHTIIAPFEQAEPWQYPSPPDTPETSPARAGALFDLEADPGEQRDVAGAHPEIVSRLKILADAALADAVKAEMPKLAKPETRAYLGPGRITEDTALSIEEALRRTRE
jgi:uncharacterized sulfatase